MLDLLLKHPRLNYLQRCLRHWRDDAFIREVLDIGKNPLKIEIRRPGDKNPGQLIYIAQTMGCDGLFAELRFLLHEFYFCDLFGFTPVALIPPESCYSEKHPVNGTDNVFEYYFDPVSDVPLADARQSSAVVEHNFYQRMYIQKVFDMRSGYLPSEAYLDKMAELTAKYLHLNSVVAPQIADAVHSIIGGRKTLGVHVRGADFKRHYRNHPNMVTTAEYLAAADAALRAHSFERIFLATDDMDALTAFQEKFGEKVHFYVDVIRTAGDETVMRSQDTRENHHYRLGLEVLRDMYTLSACDGIVAGLSNVSLFADIAKRSRGEAFTFQNYINKGIKAK